MAGRILTREFLIDCCTGEDGWEWLGQSPRWLIGPHAMVLVDPSCGEMGFTTAVRDPYRIRELLVRNADEVILIEDVSRRIPYRSGNTPDDISLDIIDEDIGQRVYVAGDVVVCVQDRLGQLLDGLVVKHSESGGPWAGIAGYDGDDLVAVVMPLDRSPREVRA